MHQFPETLMDFCKFCAFHYPVMAQNVNKNMMFYCRYRVTLSNGHFTKFITKTSGWFHVILKFIGPNEGEGIRIYHDGVEVGSKTTTGGNSKDNGTRRIVIGRYFVEPPDIHSSMQVDELLFFNQLLTDDEITMLSRFTT